MKMFHKWARLTALALGLLIYAPPLATAAADDNFYAGKQVTLVVPTGPGGGYALYGQILSRYLGRHIPGEPIVIVKYMPGGGGNVAANYLYNLAPKDGSVIAALFSTLTVTQALQPAGSQFDASKFSWLGSISPMINAVGIWHEAGVTTVEAAKTKQVAIGATGKSADLYIYPQIMNAILGTKFKIVLGYESSGDILLAMQSGEVQGMAMGIEAWDATRADWIAKKDVTLIAQNGVTRDKLMPDVPTLIELAQSPEAKQVMTFLATPAVLGRAVAAPPGIPDERLALLRKSFEETMKDPAFETELTSRHLGIDPMSGTAVSAFMQQASNTPKPLVETVRKLLNF